MKISKIVVPAVILVFSFVLILANRIIFKADSQVEKEYRYLSLFSEVVAQVKTNYVEEVDPAEKFPGAFSAMLSSLDPFSSYLDIAKTKTYYAYRSGRYCDCGIFGTKTHNYFFITDVIPNSPAARAGLKYGDIIKAVNGISLYGQSFWEMYLSLLSSEPQNIRLTLFNKKNSRETRKVELQTRLMNMHTTVSPIQHDILLVKLSHFDDAAVALLKEKLSTYGTLYKNKPLKLIIDLRTYCSGDLESFRQITRLFFKNKIALTLQQKKGKEEIFPEIKEKNTLEYKAVVIINSSTRFYGELLAAIFKNPGTGTASTPPVTLVGTITQGFIA
ncbi:MAG TPA: PDZ domain-containing protein, partial [Candidatus Kapabacteria bacterium]|nr:PDZ domain-containing protein [Candidatus Kapabacteria bacterium]